MEARTRKEVLRSMQETDDALARELEGTSIEAAARRPAEKEWSIAEVLAHLLICEEYAHARIVRMGHETNPYLSAFDDHTLLEVRGYCSTPAPEILGTLLTFARENQALLAGLSDAQWERTGRHEEKGTITVGYIAGEMLAKHHVEHLGQVRDIKRWLETQSR